MKEVKWINVRNDFYKDKFDTLCEELENGETIHIYVDCIGHTRAAWVEESYVQKLKNKYGDRFLETTGRWERAYCLKPETAERSDKNEHQGHRPKGKSQLPQED